MATLKNIANINGAPVFLRSKVELLGEGRGNKACNTYMQEKVGDCSINAQL